MREINTIIVHCSATRPKSDIGVDEIRVWHVKGNHWDDIGYHYVIRRNGLIEVGRPIEVVGAHAKGHNTGSIGVCMVGGVDVDGDPDANYTFSQYSALKILIQSLNSAHGYLRLIGHREVGNKSCPCFDVNAFMGF